MSVFSYFGRRCAFVGLVSSLAAVVCGNVWAQSASGASAAGSRLALRQVVDQVRQANKDILSKRAEKDIAATGIDRADAAFSPMASLSAADGRNRQPNTYEEKLTRDQTSFYLRDGQDYSVGVSQLLPTGAKIEAKTTLSRFITNINQKDGRPPGVQDNRTFWGVTLTQPLARDGGTEVTRARGLVARFDVAVAEHARAETETSVVAEAVVSYYELALAQHRVAAAHEKIRTGQRLLDEARGLIQQGRLPQADLLEVENSLSRFRAGLAEALQGQLERQNRLRVLLMSGQGPEPGRWEAGDPLPEVGPAEDLSAAAALLKGERALRSAFESRSDYLMQKELIEREGVQLVYAQNQALPRIDLVASFGRNGLAYSVANAYQWGVMSEYPTWSIGLQVQIPLGENKLGRADSAAASFRRENAVLALKALEVQIANDIDTSVNLVASAAERWTHWNDVARREQLQLEVERARFASGRSPMREILLREERTINSRLMVLEQQTAYAKAQVILESAQGVLMRRWAF
jgi:outer membrane protein TolC